MAFYCPLKIPNSFSDLQDTLLAACQPLCLPSLFHVTLTLVLFHVLGISWNFVHAVSFPKTFSSPHSYPSSFTCFLFCFFWDRVWLCHQAGMQWKDISSLQPPLPGFKQFSCLSLLSGTTGACHHAPLISFVFFTRDEVSPCCPGLSWTPELREFTHFGLPKF